MLALRCRIKSVLHDVRHFEEFTQLILGMLPETKRKSLPRLVKTVQCDHQALHTFLANVEWSIEAPARIRPALRCGPDRHLLWREFHSFIQALHELGLDYVVAIRFTQGTRGAPLQQFVRRDGQLAHAHAGRVVDGIGDGRGHASDADLA